MHKKILNIIISIFIIFFSFFYTNKIINIFQKNDPIMKEIIKYNDNYQEKTLSIDINKSYSNMKKIGKYDKNLLVFKEASSFNNLNINYDNYIDSLDKTQNKVSIIFILKNTNSLNEIIEILNNHNINATFFVTDKIFDNYIDKIKLLLKYNNEVELLSDNYSVYEVNKYNSILKLISNNKLLFCLNDEKDSNLLKSCKSSKLYSITTNIIKLNPYLYIKNNLENGLIIAFDNNNNIINQLPSTIKYILQKGKKIEVLKNIIS